MSTLKNGAHNYWISSVRCLPVTNGQMALISLALILTVDNTRPDTSYF